MGVVHLSRLAHRRLEHALRVDAPAQQFRSSTLEHVRSITGALSTADTNEEVIRDLAPLLAGGDDVRCGAIEVVKREWRVGQPLVHHTPSLAIACRSLCSMKTRRPRRRTPALFGRADSPCVL